MTHKPYSEVCSGCCPKDAQCFAADPPCCAKIPHFKHKGECGDGDGDKPPLPPPIVNFLPGQEFGKPQKPQKPQKPIEGVGVFPVIFGDKPGYSQTWVADQLCNIPW